MGVLLVAAGAAWAFRSVLEVFAPQYFDPVTPLDHLSVWVYTVALSLTAPAVIALSRLSTSLLVRIVSICIGAGAFVAGLANVAQDAFGLPNASYMYIPGFFVMLGGMVANAVVLAVLRHWPLAAVFALWALGIMLFTAAGGGVIVLVALGTIAVRPTWFTAPMRSQNDQGELDTQRRQP